MTRPAKIQCLAIAGLLCAISQPAQAYIGPGAGISAIGTVVALFCAVLLAIIGFVWYPVKRMWAKNRKLRKADNNPTPS